MEAPAVKHLLVLTTIHDPDDPRVRERTLASLAEVFAVDYATRAPGPSRRDDHTWIELRGNRIRRWFIGLRLMLSGAYDVVSIHDPELIPAALIARLLRRRIVVMDVHEHVPGQILHKDWVWRPLRRPVAWVAHRFLRLAERFLVVTLAEGGYQVLFKKERPVFANYPAEGALPEPADDGGYLAYVGVVNEYRGATLMVEAAGAMESPLPLVIVGRVTDEKAAEMRDLAVRLGVDLTLTGPQPHREAMETAAAGTVGLALMADVPNNRWSQPTPTTAGPSPPSCGSTSAWGFRWWLPGCRAPNWPWRATRRSGWSPRVTPPMRPVPSRRSLLTLASARRPGSAPLPSPRTWCGPPTRSEPSTWDSSGTEFSAVECRQERDEVLQRWILALVPPGRSKSRRPSTANMIVTGR